MNHQAAHNQPANIAALWRGVQRYGFQGQEEDQELWEGAVSYKYRVEDARLGRFFSVDPLAMEFPFYSTYAFSGNRVIDSYELEGLEPVSLNGKLVGYIVQSGQGPLAISQDINNPLTQKTYGYNLISKVTYLDIINSNPGKFENVRDIRDIHDAGFKKLGIKQGDLLSLGTVAKREKEIQAHNESILLKIKINNVKIAAIQKEDSGPYMTEEEIKLQQDAISSGYDGEPTRTGEAFSHIAVRALANKMNQEHDRKEANKESRIDKLKKENKTLEQTLIKKDE